MVLDTIQRMALEHKEIKKSTVSKEAGVSRPYLYKNKNVRAVIEQYENNPTHSKRTEDSKDVIITMQKEKIKELENQVKQLQKAASMDESYKKKYEATITVNKQLKKQLERAYQY
jgi:predicted RNase H-like nuclease (RuvC/YqgF family)